MFLDRFPQIKADEIFAIGWNDDPFSYDEALYSLGEGLDYFVCLNPRTDCKDLYYINEVPDTDKCIVWHNGETWLAKFFYKGWKSYKGYKEIRIQPTEMVWSWNPDIDKLMQFEEDIFGKFEPLPWDRHFKMVWYIDKRFNPLDDEVWAFSCQPKGIADPIRKEMGHVTPLVNVEYNLILPKLFIDIDECYPPFWELVNECAIELDQSLILEERIWVLKVTPAYRKPREWRWLGILTPSYQIEYNPLLPNLDFDIKTNHTYHDLKYKHFYYLDKSHLTNNEPDIWACKIYYTDEVQGDKNAGAIHPIFRITKNPQFKDLNYDIEYVVPYTDLQYEHMWFIDESYTTSSPEPIWAFKAKATKRPAGTKVIGSVKPILYIEYNPDLDGFEFDLPKLNLTYHDFQYLHIWHVNKDLIEQDKIYALTISFSEHPTGLKEHGYIDPKQEMVFNKSLNHINASIDYKIPFHDRHYEHVWYLKNKNKNIWYAKLKTQKTTIGTKEMGLVVPEIPKKLDVFFLSYGESNAEENFKRVKSFAPWAKHIRGVKGIFAAHKAAAEKSKTDMFYVVDADAYLVDDFNFKFNPEIYDRKYTFVWQSKNPFNDLEYGYGGVKLFPKSIFVNRSRWDNLDLFQSISKGVKIVEQVSNFTNFNTDEFSTWRSAFRETIKLLVNNDSKKIKTWVTKKAKYSDYALAGINSAKKFYKQNSKLELINDRDWLLEQFNRQHKST